MQEESGEEGDLDEAAGIDEPMGDEDLAEAASSSTASIAEGAEPFRAAEAQELASDEAADSSLAALMDEAASEASAEALPVPSATAAVSVAQSPSSAQAADEAMQEDEASIAESDCADGNDEVDEDIEERVAEAVAGDQGERGHSGGDEFGEMFAQSLEDLVSSLPPRGGLWLLCETDGASGASGAGGAAAATSTRRGEVQEEGPEKEESGGGGGGGLAGEGARWRLWLAHQAGERSFGRYPPQARLADDGQGGVWILCPRLAGGGTRSPEVGFDDEGRDEGERGERGGRSDEADWLLWHASQEDERCLYRYPSGSQMVGDGQGGLWILCDTTEDLEEEAGDSDFSLWHVTNTEERRLFSYPRDSRLAGDGVGGVWVLCETTSAGFGAGAGSAGEEEGEEGARRGCWTLWHAKSSGEEQALYTFPKEARLEGDGHGGAWVLAASSSVAGGRRCSGGGGGGERSTDEDWCLWHVTDTERRSLFQYPASSKLRSDGLGGIWVLCETDVDEGDGDWCLWHAAPAEGPEEAHEDGNEAEAEGRRGSGGLERCLYRYPKDSKIASDGLGGLWVLCETTEPATGEDDGGWCLWHATMSGERNLYAYPEESTIAS